MNAIWEGIVCGTILSFFIGPVFFGLLNVSMHSGFRRGMVYAIGVALSDLFYIAITYVGLTTLINNVQSQAWADLIGGGIMLAFGLYYLFKKNLSKSTGAEENLIVERKKYSKVFISGFLLNAINPGVLFFWMGTVTLANERMNHHPTLLAMFFAASIFTVFSFDCLKAYVAKRVSAFVTLNFLDILNKVLGVVILIASIYLLYKSSSYFVE